MIGKKLLFFCVGGTGYVGLEYLWRGWSHYSMFLTGGSVFLLLGGLNHARPRLPLPVRALVGSGIITAAELAAGLLVNRNYRVWDYRNMPLNYRGQICLPFSALWIPVSAGALLLYDALDRHLAPHK